MNEGLGAAGPPAGQAAGAHGLQPGQGVEDREKAAADALALIFGEAKAGLDRQLQQVPQIDTKVNTVLGSASFLTAVFLGFHRSTSTITEIETGAAVIVYGVVLLAVFRAYAIREFNDANNPVGLVAYLDRDTRTIQLQLLSNLKAAFEGNKTLIDSKADWAVFCLWGLMAEMAVILIIVVTQLFTG